jgi:hypothetical protein
VPTAEYTVAARLRAALERRLGPQVGAFLSRQAGSVGRAYGVGGIDAVGVQLSTDRPQLTRLLRTSYRVGVASQAEARFALLRVDPLYIEPRVVAFAETQSAERVVDIDDGTMRRIQQVVKGSITDKLTPRETARAIRDTLAGASRPRSFAIARTEVGTATAYGDHLAARESGLDLLKVWSTAGDGGKRHPSYPGLDGQERELDEPFDVGGFEMMHPLDPDGPAEEVVNCRCALIYRRRV